MSSVQDKFEVAMVEGDSFEVLTRKPVATAAPAATAVPSASTAHVHGFDLDDQPLIVGLTELPDEIIPARTTVPIRRADIGSTVVVLFEGGDIRLPIIVGLLHGRRPGDLAAPCPSAPRVSVQVDDDRLVLAAERELVMRCGDATITLTRAGKILIQGKYILSRSSGYNKIKGAAVDIN